MPELPEVETTRRGIAPHLEGRRIASLQVREPRLRWPVPDDLPARLAGQRIARIDRRGKYLLMVVDDGQVLWHLGMSGSLRLTGADAPRKTHDHLVLQLTEPDGRPAALELRPALSGWAMPCCPVWPPPHWPAPVWHQPDMPGSPEARPGPVRP